MNRNTNAHFSQLPQLDLPRSIFDRSHSHKTSFNAGELIPVLVEEVLPGDTVRMTTSKVIRLQTMLTPIMDNIYCDFFHFFVPNRLVWNHWQEFCGENTESAWAPTTTYSVPKIKSPDGGFASGTIADYMGLPVGVEFKEGDKLPSALPFRAYALICDTFFRDQNVTDPLNIPLGDAYQDGSNGDNYIDDVVNGGKPFLAAKFHDRFTSSLPAPLKGEPVGFPISFTPFSGELPVLTSENPVPFAEIPHIGISGYKSNGSSYWLSNVGEQGVNGAFFSSATSAGGSEFYPSNLKVTIPESAGLNTSITINDLRLAFSLQRYLEQIARSGSRYIELLSGLFGVSSPDARLQLPEYLGGNRIPVQIHQVTNTAQAEKDFLGDLGAMSLTHDVHQDYEKSFTEHGLLITVACVRYDHSYVQGMQRFWFRNEFTDFYNPIFANIGEQPVYTAELYFDPNNQDDVFGYQEAWSEYRYSESRCSGEMRPGVPNSLASWHLADYYDEAPTLSDSWIREDKTNLDRCLAVTSEVANQIFMDVYFQTSWTRVMPMYSVPMLEGHF